MDEKPLVTVYILIYKNMAKIMDAIESVVKQTYPRIELVISDDGSENISVDEIEKCIQPYKGRFENIIINKNGNNLGTVKHLNKIYSMFNGAIICGVAADDRYYDEYVVENIVTFFQNNPKRIIVTSKRIDENDNVVRPNIKLQNVLKGKNKYYKKIMFRTSPLISGAGTYYKKDIFKKYGYFPEEFKLVEDASYYSKIVAMGEEIGFLDKITYVHAKGGVSDSNRVPHPWFVKDMKYLYSTWMPRYAENEDWLTKRCVKFHKEKVENANKGRLLLLYIKYFDVCLYMLWAYKIKRWE